MFNVKSVIAMFKKYANLKCKFGDAQRLGTPIAFTGALYRAFQS